MFNEGSGIGVRVLLGEPHPSVGTEGFVEAALRDVGVQRSLHATRSRLMHVAADPELDKDADRDYCRECEAVFYDYAHNREVTVRGAAGGHGPFQVSYSNHQPVPSPDEFDDAVAIAAQSPVWGSLIRARHVTAYRPMPPVLESMDGSPVERTLYVGLRSKERQFHRIIAVNMVRREASREGISPRGAIANDQTCGVSAGDCNFMRRGTPGTVTLEWPQEQPVWHIEAIRPAASSGTNASGIELRNVRFLGHRVLKQAHIPILNVQYDQDLCGPFRDWLWQESCFQAVGTDIAGAPGFRMCTQPPQTIVESGVDEGDFQGVAVWVADDGSLRLTTSCSAGWYRYIMEWQFRLDGTILPRFRFGSTEDSCVCNIHHHHAYWRLDFDILNQNNTVQEMVGSDWTPILKETSKKRPDQGTLLWRVLAGNGKSQIGYVITPGDNDGVGDDFSGDDQYVLHYRKSEIDDKPQEIIRDAPAKLSEFVGKQSVHNTDLVVWYAAHFRHVFADNDEHPFSIGPTLQPINWPPATKPHKGH